MQCHWGSAGWRISHCCQLSPNFASSTLPCSGPSTISPRPPKLLILEYPLYASLQSEWSTLAPRSNFANFSYHECPIPVVLFLIWVKGSEAGVTYVMHFCKLLHNIYHTPCRENSSIFQTVGTHSICGLSKLLNRWVEKNECFL